VQKVQGLIAYLRVSTARQGRSGLGLEAQREAVMHFMTVRCAKIIAEFVEVESGKKDDRPELQKPLKRPSLAKSAFLMTLRDSGVEFLAADLPEANTMSGGVMALVAQYEREAISARTTAALAVAKERGQVLGGLRRGSPDIGRFQKRAVLAVRRKALESAEERCDLLEALATERLSMNAMAVRLNEASVRTRRGGQWTATAVKRVMERLALI
jgi:DNA invertase Pin-like site-specific DNA recombinase